MIHRLARRLFKNNIIYIYFYFRMFFSIAMVYRLARRLARDIAERGRDKEGCLKQWNRFVQPSFEKYIEPTKRDASDPHLDLICTPMLCTGLNIFTQYPLRPTLDH